MKIRIINGVGWYQNLYGNVYDVYEKNNGNLYFLKYPPFPQCNFIFKSDAEVVRVQNCSNCGYKKPCNRCGNDERHPEWIPDVPYSTGTTEEAKHYQVGAVQPIEVMQNTMTKEQFIGYCLGNVIKYSLRMNHKEQMRSDAGKCKQYAEWLICAIDDVQIVPGGKN